MARLQLLNGFELTCDEREVPVPPCAQRLLALLAISDRPLQRLFVAGVLWPESSEEHAAACLRSALWRARRCGDALVIAGRNDVRLAREVAVDLREQTALAQAILAGRPGVRFADVRSLLAGELLPDWYDDWVLVEREHLRQLRLHALEVLAERAIAAGRYAEALEASLCVLGADTLRETTHRLVVKTHLAEGNRGEAVRHYRLYEAIIRERLDLEPAFRFEDLAA